MVAVNVADLTARFPELLEQLRRGEQVVIVQNGKTVAQLKLAPDAVPAPVENMDEEDDEDAPRPWRGVFADLPPAMPIKLPIEASLPPPRTTLPSLAWLPIREDDDE